MVDLPTPPFVFITAMVLRIVTQARDNSAGHADPPAALLMRQLCVGTVANLPLAQDFSGL